MLPDWDGRLARLAQSVFGRTTARREFTQLRTATTLEAIRPATAELPRFTFRDASLADRAYLLRLAELGRPLRERRHDPGALPQVAAAFEDLARRAQPGTHRRLELLAEAASMWSVAGYQANSVVLAEALVREVEADGQEPTLGMRLALLVSAILLRDLAFAEREGREAVEAVPALGDALLAAAGDDQVPLDDVAMLAAYGLVGRAAVNAVRFWQRGDETAAVRALTAADRARSILLAANVADAWLLVDNLRVVLEDAFASSLWRGLRGRVPVWNNLWRRHIGLLAEDERPVVEIWPSQRQALKQGLLSPERTGLAVRMPTSAGKTRMAEFAILTALANRPGERLAAYIVPTRALAAEVEDRLTNSLGAVGLRVSALFGGFDSPDYELQLVENTDVLVVTPEKLDLLLRQDNTLTDRLALAVFDEGHLLADTERGLRLELLIARLRRRVPGARLLVLSAVLPNVEEIGRWLEPAAGGANAIAVDWTPSRLARGVFYWQGRAGPGQHGRVAYEGHGESFIPYVLQRQRLRTNLYPSTKSETAAELALHYQRLGPVIVGAATKRLVQGVVNALDKGLRRHGRAGDPVDLIRSDRREELARLVALVKEAVGPTHKLARYVTQGFAFHTADLPEALRVAIERAFRNGTLRILVATSTLSQGVNLPVKTVIVSHTRRDQTTQIPVREFWNLAGRAGRALAETEGHVLLVADDAREAQSLARRYLDPRRVEPVRSVLYGLLAEVARARFPTGGLGAVSPEADLGEDELARGVTSWDALDGQLLAMAAEEIVDTEDEAAVEAVIGSTLCGVQLATAGAPLAPFGRYLARRFAALKARVPDPEQRRRFYRTGLSLQGCEALLGELDRLLAENPTIVEPDRFDELRRRLLEAATAIPEFQQACKDQDVPPAAVPALVADWMGGGTIEHLRTAHGTPLGKLEPMSFSACHERVVVRDLPWVLSAAVELLRLRLGEDWEPWPALSALPSMAKFGLDSVEACYAASVGFRRRTTARTVGVAFAEAGGGSLPQFLAWLGAFAPEDVRRLSGTLEDPEAFVHRLAVVTGDGAALRLLARGEGVIRAPLRGLNYNRRWERVARVDVGAEIVLRRESGNLHDPHAILVRDAGDADLGYVSREVARGLAPLLDGGQAARAVLVARSGQPRVDAATIEITVEAAQPGDRLDASA